MTDTTKNAGLRGETFAKSIEKRKVDVGSETEYFL